MILLLWEENGLQRGPAEAGAVRRLRGPGPGGEDGLGPVGVETEGNRQEEQRGDTMRSVSVRQNPTAVADGATGQPPRVHMPVCAHVCSVCTGVPGTASCVCLCTCVCCVRTCVPVHVSHRQRSHKTDGHMCAYTREDMHAQMHLHTCAHVCTHKCISVCADTCVCAHLHTVRVCVHMQVYTSVCVHVCVREVCACTEHPDAGSRGRRGERGRRGGRGTRSKSRVFVSALRNYGQFSRSIVCFPVLCIGQILTG